MKFHKELSCMAWGKTVAEAEARVVEQLAAQGVPDDADVEIRFTPTYLVSGAVLQIEGSATARW